MEKTNLTIGIPPADTNLEAMMLGTLIARDREMDNVREVMSEMCFSTEQNRAIFRVMADFYRQGRRWDLILVSNELEKAGIADATMTVMRLTTGQTLAGNVTEYALILRDYGIRRRLWEEGMRLMQGASDSATDVSELQNRTRQSLDSLFEDTADRFVTLRETYEELHDHILQNQQRAEGKIAGTPTGFGEIDRNGGLCGSDLIVVGAETSQGKTSFTTAMTVKAITEGKRVAFYSMEMNLRQLTARVAAMESGIPATKILYGKLEDSELERIDATMDMLPGENLYFDGNSTSSLDKIVFSIRSLKAKHDISGAVIDYLQLISTGDRGVNPEQKAAMCARTLKNLAKELDIWIIAISQLRRDNNNPMPTLSRLRDSGQIEEAADNIYLIYRPRDGKSYPEGEFRNYPTESTALVKIAKGRNVGVGEFICGFDPKLTLFYPLTEEQKREMNDPGAPFRAVMQEDPKPSTVTKKDEELPF